VTLKRLCILIYKQKDKDSFQKIYKRQNNCSQTPKRVEVNTMAKKYEKFDSDGDDDDDDWDDDEDEE